MFYQLESLKKGGRFYLCWLADSYPEGFKKISYRQLWSQDLKEICDDLYQVMMSESGRPVKRYSLRLSSQLLRGLVRLYNKKVCSFLSHLYSLDARIFRETSKKWAIDEERPDSVARIVPLQTNVQTAAAALHDEPENEERVEEIIQQSGNVVSDIQNITLKESAMLEHQMPIDDGFGEEHPEQALQLLADRTLELMLLQPAEGAQLSGAELAADGDATGRDESRNAAPAPAPARMERMSDRDMHMLDKSIGQATLHEDFEKEIPRTPEILHPELPAPETDDQLVIKRRKEYEIQEPSVTFEVQEPWKEIEPVMELEELEDTSPPAKRRRLGKKLIIDKRIKLGSELLRARLQNPKVDLRCEESSMDIVDLCVPWDVLMRRAAHAGWRLPSRLGFQLAQRFSRSVAYSAARPSPDRELEEAMDPRQRQSHSRIVTERNEEIDASVLAPPPGPVPVPVPEGAPEEAAAPETSLLDAVAPELDVSLLPTQIIETLSQQKRRLADDAEASPKKQRCHGIKTSQKKSQKKDMEIPTFVIDEVIKENVAPEEYQQAPPIEKSITNMLQEAGIADMQTDKQMAQDATVRKSGRRNGSERSETPLGSLDRTKVSLGDSDTTTDSMKFLREHWGTEGTMCKIMAMIRNGMKPVTVETLVANGPVIAGQKKFIAARCFISILKLKQHGFINVLKNADLAIQDITLTENFRNF